MPTHECFSCGEDCPACWVKNQQGEMGHRGDPWLCACPHCPATQPAVPPARGDRVPPPMH
jgi:hypothetical protein